MPKDRQTVFQQYSGQHVEIDQLRSLLPVNEKLQTLAKNIPGYNERQGHMTPKGGKKKAKQGIQPLHVSF